VIDRLLPEALVTGAEPAYALSARGSAKRVRSSPIGEHAGPGHIAEAGEAGDDLVVGVLGERLGGGLAELVDAGALGV
jgi:hypothetical protein